MMQFLERKDIDAKKWDERIANSPVENIFSYSWYLDAVSNEWGAIISRDYNTILPVPYTKKLGVKQYIQAPFTREYEIFGNDFDWNEVTAFLAKDFRGIHFRTSNSGLFKNEEHRKHQYLKLTDNIIDGYSTNAKRLIKKANKSFTYHSIEEPSKLLDLFKENVWDKVKTISATDLEKLEKLMKVALDRGRGELIAIFEADKIVGAGFFLKDKNRITYLKGAAEVEAKKQGAMYGLFDHAIHKFSADFETLDFGGSDVENVAVFYKKFGARDRTYYDYTIDNLPLWYKTLKRIKQ